MLEESLDCGWNMVRSIGRSEIQQSHTRCNVDGCSDSVERHRIGWNTDGTKSEIRGGSTPEV